MNEAFKTKRLSNRQFSLMMEAAETGGITLKRMLHVPQITAGSLVKAGLLAWDHGAGVFLPTNDGYDTMSHFQHTTLERVGAYRPLSSRIQNRELDQLTRGLRETYKHEYDEQKHREREKERGVDRVKEARFKMKTKRKEKQL